MSIQPIGIFDSGIGGTSIFKEIKALLPHEHTVYLADSFNAPYGNKSKEEIIALSIKNTELLIAKDCKLIVVACNTATTNAIKTLRDTYDLPFIGIEPAIKPAALSTQTKSIGILATKGTLTSELFHKTTDLYSHGIQVIEQVGEGIVTLIEDGRTNSEEMKILLQTYLKPMLDANIDYLVLGCTHYPYLIPLLLDMLPNHVKIIDSGEAVARQTKSVLELHQLLNKQTSTAINQFYTNGNVDVLKDILDENYNVDYLRF
ncbi:MAG: glutamate racemase [Gelidibacter sp.]